LRINHLTKIKNNSLSILNIILGLLLILLGFFIIKYYEESVNKKGLSFKIKSAGVGLIIIGIGLILKEFSIV